MNMRDAICGTCGLALCLCLLAGEIVELAHLHLPGRPSVVATVPGRGLGGPDHTHAEPGRFVSLRENGPVGGTGGGIVVTPATAAVQASTSAPTVTISDLRA